jgi:hypothetical protein
MNNQPASLSERPISYGVPWMRPTLKPTSSHCFFLNGYRMFTMKNTGQLWKNPAVTRSTPGFRSTIAFRFPKVATGKRYEREALISGMDCRWRCGALNRPIRIPCMGSSATPNGPTRIRLPDHMLRELIEHFSSQTLSIANCPEDELGWVMNI